MAHMTDEDKALIKVTGVVCLIIFLMFAGIAMLMQISEQSVKPKEVVVKVYMYPDTSDTLHIEPEEFMKEISKLTDITQGDYSGWHYVWDVDGAAWKLEKIVPEKTDRSLEDRIPAELLEQLRALPEAE